MSKLIAFLLLTTLAHAEQFGAGHVVERMSHALPPPSTQSSNLIIGAGRDSLIVTKDTVINGDLTILHHGALVIRGATLEMHGNIYLTDSATFTGEGGTLSYPQDYLYEWGLITVGKAHLSLHNVVIDIAKGNGNASVGDSSIWELHHVTFPNSFFTMGVANKGRFSADSCVRCGEFIFTDSSRSTFTNSGFIISWPWMARGQSADVSFPDTVVAKWAYPDSARSSSGIAYHVSYSNCHDILWMLLHTSGSSITIRNSRVRAIGVVITGHDSLSLTGIADGSAYSDWNFPDPDRTLHLINSTVLTWNYYPFDSTKLSLTNCIFGELLAEGRSTVTMTGSTCDATGGYFSSTDSAHIQATYSTFNCMVVARMRSNMFLIQSTIWQAGPMAGITTERAGGIILANCTFNAIPNAFDTSMIVVAGIDPPARMVGGQTYDVLGGAEVIAGPISVVKFKHYSLSFAPVNDTAYQSIGDIVETPLLRGVVGRWKAPLIAGMYTVRLCLAHNFGDSICPTTIVQVDAPSSVHESAPGPFALTIAPQPAHTETRIYSPMNSHGTLILFDVLGRIVRRQEFSGGEATVDVRGLARGMYRVAVQGSSDHGQGIIIVE